ncbi:hypothetical protein EJB05_54978 [Eragrostis curvula]|uniref:Uncharacterized protein n=1 Tax=Eragrostis curvula TaxID=38414 RepID=A0A5J9SL03_9POAL|nr:hypothetical protein EJB05_54978 [Eragrostis curvula]
MWGLIILAKVFLSLHANQTLILVGITGRQDTKNLVSALMHSKRSTRGSLEKRV